LKEARMKELKDSEVGGRRQSERGISVLEIIIVVTIIGVVTAFAILRISAAQRAMRLTNSTREFISYLERARIDSIRRRPMNVGEMARVTINTVNSYSVQLDQDGDGLLDAPRTITIADVQGARFAGVAIPTIIYFDWRGRPVNGFGNNIALNFRMEDASGANPNPINLTSIGDMSLSNNTNTSTVTVVDGASAGSNVNPNGKIP
jgi:type II secretory pathway pseudopilin PulG